MAKKREDGFIEYRCAPPCNHLLCYYKPTEQYAFEIKCPKQNCKTLNYRGNIVPTVMVEWRCDNIDEKRSKKIGKPVVCNKLLGYILEGTVLERKCPRCGNIATTVNTKDGDSTHENS